MSGRTAKEEQERISPNHVQTIFHISVVHQSFPTNQPWTSDFVAKFWAIMTSDSDSSFLGIGMPPVLTGEKNLRIVSEWKAEHV